MHLLLRKKEMERGELREKRRKRGKEEGEGNE